MTKALFFMMHLKKMAQIEDIYAYKEETPKNASIFPVAQAQEFRNRLRRIYIPTSVSAPKFFSLISRRCTSPTRVLAVLLARHTLVLGKHKAHSHHGSILK